MNTKRLFEKLTHNWPAKVICFVAALFLYALYQISSLGRETISVPLSVTAEGAMLPAGSYPSRVKVTVRGRSEDIMHLNSSDIKASLDITYYAKEGTYDVPVSLTFSPDIMLTDPLDIRVIPESVPITVENRAYGYVKISPLVDGTPAHGYEQSSIVVSPSSVRISGPRSMVESDPYIQTDQISVDDKTESFTEKVGLLNTNKFITLQDDNNVEVTVKITPIQSSKNFENIPVVFTNVPKSFQIEDTSTVVSLTLSGSLLALENYIPDSTVATVDCSAIKKIGEYELPIVYQVPDALHITKKSAETVTFTVEIKLPDVNQETGETPPEEKVDVNGDLKKGNGDT